MTSQHLCSFISVCLAVCIYIHLSYDNLRSSEATITKFGTHDDLEKNWCGYDFGSKSSKFKVEELGSLLAFVELSDCLSI